MLCIWSTLMGPFNFVGAWPISAVLGQLSLFHVGGSEEEVKRRRRDDGGKEGEGHGGGGAGCGMGMRRSRRRIYFQRQDSGVGLGGTWCGVTAGLGRPPGGVGEGKNGQQTVGCFHTLDARRVGGLVLPACIVLTVGFLC